MLRLRPCKGANSSDPSHEKVRFDIHDGGLAIGSLTYDRRSACGAFNVGDSEFTIEPAAASREALAAASKAIAAAARPVALLRNDAGAVLARAERERDVYIVGRDGESFILQAGRSRLYYHLRREGDVVNLGGVGKPNFWTSSLEVNLRAGFAASFQVFLASLVIDQIVLPHAGAAP
jgi:hypothetical protein